MNDPRFIYLVKTLSRTKRKDYENYVINAVWNRLGDSTIRPASQWHVKNPDGWHLIDLYFPQINFGVECDEAFHKGSQEKDNQRELTLIEVLSASSKHPYQAFHINVDRPVDEIEQNIDECVKSIKALVAERRKSGEFVEWSDVDLASHFKDKQIIHTGDDILFPRIVDIVNHLMQTNAGAYMMGYFTPKGLDPTYKFWCPQLEVEGKAQSRGWHNILSKNGDTITEYNENIEANMASPQKISTVGFLNHTRVTFAKVRDPVTNKRAYKFVGLFKFKDVDDNNVRTYVKISDTFDARNHNLHIK